MAKPRRFRILHATDGSASARAAMATSAAFPWPSHSEARAIIVRPGLFLPPNADLWARSEAVTHRAAVTKRRAAAEQRQERVAARLREAGWRVRGQVRAGAPLYELLRSVDETRADALVVGATSQRSTLKEVLGSTIEGAVNRSAVPVLVVP